MALLPMMLVGASLTPFSARLTERLGARTLITGGLVTMTSGLAILAFVPSSTPHLGARRADGPGRTGGSPGEPAGDGGPAQQRPRPPSRHGQRRVQHQPQIGGALAVAVFGALLAQQGGFMQGLRVSLLLAAGVALAVAASSVLLKSSARQGAPAVESASAPTGAAGAGAQAGNASTQGAVT